MKIEDTHDLVEMVARHLDGWEYTRPPKSGDIPPWPTVNGPDGQKIYFRSGYQLEGRLSISGSYARDKSGYNHSPGKYRREDMGNPTDSITVSGTKTPEQIARDIERRLLPGYQKLFNYAAKQVKEADNAKAAADKNINEIGEIFNVEPHGQGKDTVHLRQDSMPGGGWVDFTVESSGSTCIEMKYISHDLAVKIARLLKGEIEK